jgi:hypothetical protein
MVEQAVLFPPELNHLNHAWKKETNMQGAL